MCLLPPLGRWIRRSRIRRRERRHIGRPLRWVSSTRFSELSCGPAHPHRRDDVQDSANALAKGHEVTTVYEGAKPFIG